MNEWKIAGNKCSLEVGRFEPMKEQSFEIVLYW